MIGFHETVVVGWASPYRKANVTCYGFTKWTSKLECTRLAHSPQGARARLGVFQELSVRISRTLI